MTSNPNFSLNKFNGIIENLKLNLNDLTVLTEAATGPYAVTAVIAAYSGANVLVYAKDSSYGTAADAYQYVFDLSEKLNCRNKINIYDPATDTKIDIITNSGHLRPINKELLSKLSKNGLVLLMYEDWELRPSDIDLKYCIENNIKVIATNERHESIDVFGFLGDMAMKQILDFKTPIYNSNILLLCNNFFGPYMAKTLSVVCSNLYIVGHSEAEYKNVKNTKWICEFDDFSMDQHKLPESIDYIVYTAYPFQTTFFGDSSKKIDASVLKKKYNDIILFRFCGDVDCDYLDKINMNYHPTQVKSGHMGIIPSDIGYEPVIRLQAGSLKAGELALRSETDHNNKAVAVPINLTNYIK